MPSQAPKITSNKTIADPSFTKDSPSIKVDNVLEAPNSFKYIYIYIYYIFICIIRLTFNKETTATGSVAPNIDPNKNESLNLNPSF